MAVKSSIQNTLKNPKIEKNVNNSSGIKLPTENKLNESNIIILKRENNFKSIGTHCLCRISPKVNEIIKSQVKDKIIHIASFDLDDTLIKTKTGRKFSSSANDWKWWSDNVTEIIKNWLNEKSDNDANNILKLVVIFTNQGAVVNTTKLSTYSKSLDTFMNKINNILNSDEFKDIPNILYAATKKSAADKKAKTGSLDILHDTFRKPKTGMWKQLQQDLSSTGTISLENSFFVGDAAGRKNDFSDSDLVFARALGLQHRVPEDFFHPTSRW
ncbi:hypothetical protein C6P42_005431 [Pichia californica]|nr:hypothetical protein C6P42_005431 [[Candida] californica]